MLYIIGDKKSCETARAIIHGILNELRGPEVKAVKLEAEKEDEESASDTNSVDSDEETFQNDFDEEEEDYFNLPVTEEVESNPNEAIEGIPPLGII